MGIGANIKAVLSDRRSTIKQLAIDSGVPVNTLYSITQRDSKRIQGDILQKIANALEVSTDVLIYGSDIDREYEDLCETLNTAGLSIETAGFDRYYVWHEDAEDPKEDRAEFEYSDLLQIVKAVQLGAETHKDRYIKQRLETELF